jgi:hypothetical protein
VRLGLIGIERSWDDPRMASEVDAAQDSVILASFESRHAAERMLASLRRGFRRRPAKGT